MSIFIVEFSQKGLPRLRRHEYEAEAGQAAQSSYSQNKTKRLQTSALFRNPLSHSNGPLIALEGKRNKIQSICQTNAISSLIPIIELRLSNDFLFSFTIKFEHTTFLANSQALFGPAANLKGYSG